MRLTELPLEIFQAITTETVSLVGVCDAVKLRLVSKLFDTEVQRAIFTHPGFDSFSSFEDGEAFRLPWTANTSFVTKLILSKMDREDRNKRPLCHCITRALDYLETELGADAIPRLQVREALAKAAARYLPAFYIAYCLVSNPEAMIDSMCQFTSRPARRFAIQYMTPSSEFYIDSTPQDAIVALLLTGNFQLAERLLTRGVQGTKKSFAFGVPLEVAASVGARDVVRLILDQVENKSFFGSGLDKPIFKAVKRCHEHVALYMLQRRTPDPLKGELVLDPAYYVRRQLAFWETLSKIAKRRGCEDVLKISLEAAARIEDHLSRHRIEPKDKDIEMEDKDTSAVSK